MSIIAPPGFLSLQDAVGMAARRQASSDEQPVRSQRSAAAAALRVPVLEGKIALFACFTHRSEPVRLFDRQLLSAGLMPNTDTLITFAYINRMPGAPFNLTWAEIEQLLRDPICISDAELKKWLQTQPTYQRKPRGRPREYDWEAFEQEAFRILGYIGTPFLGDPKWRKADLKRRMTEWCHKAWGSEPSPSMVDKHVTRIIDKFRRMQQVDK